MHLKVIFDEIDLVDYFVRSVLKNLEHPVSIKWHQTYNLLENQWPKIHYEKNKYKHKTKHKFNELFKIQISDQKWKSILIFIKYVELHIES